MGNYLSSDIVLSCELSLYGEFVQVHDVVFWRSGKAILPAPKEIYPLYGIGKKISKLHYPFLTVSVNHAKSIFRSPLPIPAKLSLLLNLICHELKIIVAKSVFRVATALLGAKCPKCIISTAISIAGNNPNIQMLKPFRELPPALQPTWKLLNHKNSKRAALLQREITEKLL